MILIWQGRQQNQSERKQICSSIHFLNNSHWLGVISWYLRLRPQEDRLEMSFWARLREFIGEVHCNATWTNDHCRRYGGDCFGDHWGGFYGLWIWIGSVPRRHGSIGHFLVMIISTSWAFQIFGL
jgi:hypothetical protein